MHQVDSAQVTAVHSEGKMIVMQAMAPVISPLESSGAMQIGTVAVVLHFDTSQSYAARLRSLVDGSKKKSLIRTIYSVGYRLEIE